jgi:hypothetical protein
MPAPSACSTVGVFFVCISAIPIRDDDYSPAEVGL